MKYKKLNEYNNERDYHSICQAMYQLWNDEYQQIYPISEELFLRNVSNAYLDASYVVIDKDSLVGFIICKIWNDDFKIDLYDDNAWISLFLVKSSYRGQGIGSRLLENVEKEVEKLRKKRLYLGRDYLNFFPGLPVDLKNNLSWFEKRGFKRPDDTYDLIKIKQEKVTLKNNNITYRICTLDDKDNLIEFIKRNWPGRWTKEAVDYFNNGGTGKEYAIGLDNNQICAFARISYPTTATSLIAYSLTWRNRFEALGGIGPLGVDSMYRKKHIGFDIVAFANNVLVDSNASEIIIDWTGLLDFYRKLGFEVFKSYLYMIKEI